MAQADVGEDVAFRVAFNGQDEVFRLPPTVSLGELSSLLYSSFAALPATQKLLIRSASRVKLGDWEGASGRAAGEEGRRGAQGKAKEKGKGAVLALADPMTAAITLREAGITQGSALLLLGATDGDLTAVAELSKDDPTLRGFQEEAEMEARRHDADAARFSTAFHAAPGGYGFEGFKVMEPRDVGLAELHPPPGEALNILHALAADWGIRAIMKKHKWRVWLMSEMPPIGLVGISPRCVLGFNVNRGQEISLRLRTDDLKGFRKLAAIRSTLLHELAHMVHDEHDNHFKAFNSQLVRESSIGAPGLPVLGTVKLASSNRAGPALSQPHKVSAQGTARPLNPRSAAAEAALARLQQSQAPDSVDREQMRQRTSFEQSSHAELDGGEKQASQTRCTLPEEAVEGDLHRAEVPAAETMGDPHSRGVAGIQVKHEPERAALDGQSQSGGAPWAGGDDLVLASAGALEMGSAKAPVTGQDAPGECPSELRVVAGTALAIERRLGEQLQQLWEQHGHSRSGMQHSLSTLRTILRNVLENINEPRYRSIRKGNKAFHKAVGSFPAALEFLGMVGFNEAKDGEGTALLRCGTVDPGLFWLACSAVDALAYS